MSDLERIEKAAGLHPSSTDAQVRTAPRPRLSRVWFDMIVIVAVGVSLAVGWVMRIWPVGCADDDVKARAAASVRQQAVGATAVSLHLIGKVSRSHGDLHCKAFSRIEYTDRPYEHRSIVYVVHTDRAGHLTDVSASLEPPER